MAIMVVAVVAMVMMMMAMTIKRWMHGIIGLDLTAE